RRGRGPHHFRGRHLMAWSVDGPTVAQATRQGWTVDGPAATSVASRLGWVWVPQASVGDDAGGADTARLLPVFGVAEGGASGDGLYMGVDPTQDFELHVPVWESGGGWDTVAAHPAVTILDGAAGCDGAGLGVVGEAAAGCCTDSAAAHPAVVIRNGAASADQTTGKPIVTARDDGAVGDSATAGWSAQAAATTTFTSAGTWTYTIPVWATYIDLILLGGGGGGGGSASSSWYGGAGGSAGSFATYTVQRGVDIPWATTSFSVIVGSAGTAASNSAGGAGGGCVVLYYDTTGAAVTPYASGGAGGARNSLLNSSTAGGSPGSTTYNGVTYTGGTGGAASSTGNGSAGTAPGAGGGGAGYGQIYVSNKSGGVGAGGRAWIRAYQ
ncbi:MAG: hypothetical protein QM662_19500, partial [Gordonia sp. (in: high G+C Gram-positive bacteria)]